MRARGMMLAAMAFAMAGAAGAQEAPVAAPVVTASTAPPLTYTCPGLQPALMNGRNKNAMMPGRRMKATSAQMTKTLAERHTRALLEVVVDGPVVRVRPPEGAGPSLARSPDGWYQLADVALDAAAIRGQATYGLIAKPRLEFDRKTGEVSYGEFRGKCRLKRPPRPPVVHAESAKPTEPSAAPATETPA